MRTRGSRLTVAAGVPACRFQNPAGRDACRYTTAPRAFSLIEVVAAVAIFAIGMVAVLGLFTPVTKSVANVGEAEAAARVADAVRARLSTLPFNTALALIKDPAVVRTNDASGSYNPNDGTRNPTVIFGRLDGEIGIYDGTEGRRNWRDSLDRAMPDGDKFFEVDLIRNETFSPRGENNVNDARAAMLAFNIRVRWPAFVRTSPTTAVQFGQNPAGGPVAFDHGKKQVMFFTGSIMR